MLCVRIILFPFTTLWWNLGISIKRWIINRFRLLEASIYFLNFVLYWIWVPIWWPEIKCFKTPTYLGWKRWHANLLYKPTKQIWKDSENPKNKFNLKRFFSFESIIENLHKKLFTIFYTSYQKMIAIKIYCRR